MARFIYGAETLRRRFGEGRLLGDAHNDFEFLFIDPERETVIIHAPFELLEEPELQRLACGDELRGVLTHLGRLRYHVPDYPLSTLLTARPSGASGVRGADTDWIGIGEIVQHAGAALAGDRPDQAKGLLLDALAAADEQPDVLLQLASLQLRAGSLEEALITLRRFQALEPNDEAGYRMQGMVAWGRGQRRDAVALMMDAVRVDPHSSNAHRALGSVLVAGGQTTQGIVHLRQSLAIEPDRPETQRLLEAALRQLRTRDTGMP